MKFSKVLDGYKKTVTDKSLDNIIELAREVANEVIPTTDAGFSRVLMGIMIEAAAKATVDSTKSAADGAITQSGAKDYFDACMNKGFQKKYLGDEKGRKEVINLIIKTLTK